MQAACEEAPEIVKSDEVDVLSGARPLHAAAGAGQAEATSLLLQHGAPVDGLDGRGHTALQAKFTGPLTHWHTGILSCTCKPAFLMQAEVMLHLHFQNKFWKEWKLCPGYVIDEPGVVLVWWWRVPEQRSS